MCVFIKVKSREVNMHHLIFFLSEDVYHTLNANTLEKLNVDKVLFFNLTFR